MIFDNCGSKAGAEGARLLSMLDEDVPENGFEAPENSGELALPAVEL